MYLRKTLCSHLLWRGDRQELGNVLFFLTGIRTIRWPCWCTKQKQNAARQIPKTLLPLFSTPTWLPWCQVQAKGYVAANLIQFAREAAECQGGSLDEWLGCWTSEIQKSQVQVSLWQPAGVVLSVPWLNSLAALGNSQLVCLPPVRILKCVVFILYCFVSFVWGPLYKLLYYVPQIVCALWLAKLAGRVL